MEKKRKNDEKRQDRIKKKEDGPLPGTESGIVIGEHPDADCPPERRIFGS